MGSTALGVTDTTIVPIDQAHITTLPIGDGKTLWLRTWGCATGTPVLFVHGGPGQCVADYNDINAKFFEASEFHVVEVDQRGTGSSQPSVRDDYKHMQLYKDITIAQMSADFELVREHLQIDKWLVFGGSWGSTLGLDYALRYPQRCLGLILRGIFLSTVAEFEAIYARKSFAGNERRLAEFDTFLEPAAALAQRKGEAPLDPDDAQRLVRLYEELFLAGDRQALWQFYAFENNLIEEDASKLIDPRVINEAEFAEAQSVSFFEARLFLRHTYEDPVQLLGERLRALAGTDEYPAVRTWIAQGTGDEVCPETFARQLAAGLDAAGVPLTAYFFEAGHSAKSDEMGAMLKRCVDEWKAGQKQD